MMKTRRETAVSRLKSPTILAAIAALGLALPAPAQPPANPDPARQQQYLEDSLAINYSGRGRYKMTTLHDETWSDWQNRTGELPPDFAQMRSTPLLPDPLTAEKDGQLVKITTPEAWDAERDAIREKFQYWVSGSVPPAPGNTEATILDERMDGDVRVQMIELRFGPDQQGTMTLELITPTGYDGPMPVYMTQWNHRDWAQLAVRRGYIGCVYAGADAKDDTDAYASLYPDYEFSQLMRRAWGASRVVDYLLTLPEVHPDQIAITGHSRNGKQSLWATAFDERIGAVITSSCGTGGIMPWRFSDPQYCNETLDAITGIANVWFHPRLRYFFGREDKLPVDQNELLAVIAPRPLLMHFSYMERQSNIWAAEKCFHSVKSVYDFLGASDNIGIFPRQGEHAVAARDVERCIDFLDHQFGRRDVPWENTLFFDYDFDQWAALNEDLRTSAAHRQKVTLKPSYTSPEEIAADRQRILEELDWLLGDEPPGVKSTNIGETAPSRVDWHEGIAPRPTLKNAKDIVIGPYSAMNDHLPGTLYYPVDKDGNHRLGDNGKIPVIIYLHQYAYAHGFKVGYRPGGGSQRVFQRCVDAGFAVLAIDMFGFGTRLEEATHFYKRQPGWSKMGKMVADVSSCIDGIETFDFLDHDRIFVLGDTIGGSVALMAAARDQRIAATAVVAAFSPWRTSNDRYQSLRNFSHEHGFMPRLGFFAENPADTPVDYPEIMAAIAPRPLIVVAPELDRHSDPQAVDQAMDSVANVYSALDSADNLQLETPREINRLTDSMHKTILEFFDHH